MKPLRWKKTRVSKIQDALREFVSKKDGHWCIICDQEHTLICTGLPKVGNFLICSICFDMLERISDRDTIESRSILSLAVNRVHRIVSGVNHG